MNFIPILDFVTKWHPTTDLCCVTLYNFLYLYCLRCLTALYLRCTGAFTMDLNRFPRGAKSSKLCTLNMLTDPHTPHMSLFKQKRVKGWWPFAVKSESGEDYELTVRILTH